MTQTPPLYVIGDQQPGGSQFYTLNGGHLGFSEGQTGTGSVAPVLTAMNNHLGTYWEALNIGLPNDMSDPAASGKVLDQLAGATVFPVFFAPLVPNDKSATGGSISKGLGPTDLGLGYGGAYGTGAYDTKIAQTAVSLRARGIINASLRWTEFNGSNFPWSAFYTDPNTHAQNGMANVHTMMQRYLNIMRTPSLVPGFSGALGYQGWFDANGYTHSPSLNDPSVWAPHLTDSIPNRIILGGDVYSQINNPYPNSGGIAKDDLIGCWAALEVQIDRWWTYARANGFLVGIGEMGCIYNCTSPYSTNDNGYHLQKLQAKCAANADLVAYACLYNETVGNENDGMFYEGSVTGADDTLLGTGPSPVGGTAATYKSSSNTSLTWVDTPSQNKQLALASYKTYWKAGSMQYTAPVAPPPAVSIPITPLGARRRRRGWIKA